MISPNDSTRDPVPNGTQTSTQDPVPVRALIPRTNGKSLARPAAPDAQNAIKLPVILAALRRRWLLALLLGTTCAAAAAAAAWVFIPAPYTAFAELRISSVQNRILFKTAEERASFDVWKQTQIKYVKSHFVLNAALRKPDVANLSLIRGKERPVHWLEQNLQVAGAGNEFIKVSLSGEQPAELAKVLNAVVESYLAEIVEGQQGERAARLANLEKVHRDAEEQLRKKQLQLRTLSESLQAGNPTQANQRQQFLNEYTLQLRKELAQVQLELVNAKVQANLQTQHGEKKPELEIPDAVIEANLERDSEVLEAKQKLAKLQTNLNEHRDRLFEDHPIIKELQKKVEAAQEVVDETVERLRPHIAERLAAQITSDNVARMALAKVQNEHQVLLLEARKKHLDEELENYKTRGEQAGIKSFDLEALHKQIAQSEALAQKISTEIEMAKVESQTPVGISLHRAAEVPWARNQSKKIGGTVLAGLGMLVLIAGGIVWIDVQSRRISMMDQVVDGLSMRVLGTVPIIPRVSPNSRNQRTIAKGVYWQNVLAESIDSTRTFLLRDVKVDSLRSVMITSALGGEGKTTLSCHLATSMARAGRTVVLVDCDLRRPSVHRVFGLSATPGLCEVLRGEIELADALQPSGTDGLAILSAGRVCPVSLKELAQDRVGGVLARLGLQFDFVIVDSSPVLPLPDSLLVAQHVDGVLLSIRRDVSRSAKVANASQRLNMLGVPVLGAVVIGLDEGTYGYHQYR